MTSSSPLGFIGLGVMGQPMALNLQRAGRALVVWNRTAERCAPLIDAGARAVQSAEAVIEQCDTIVVMLANAAATDAVLGRQRADFAARIGGKTLVLMGTNPPAWSAQLAEEIEAAGATYVEAPVSGSRGPAIDGNLVAMIAARDESSREAIADLIAPMCSRTFDAGAVPGALKLKLAVNLYLITMVTGLAECAHAAEEMGVDLKLLQHVLDAGPMASDVSRAKLAKLVAADFSVQAAIRDVAMNCGLVADAAQRAGADAPLLTSAMQAFERANTTGLGDRDMIGVIEAMRARCPTDPRSVVAGQLAAYNARDLDRFMDFWSDDALCFSQAGKPILCGAAEIRERHRQRFADEGVKAVLLDRIAVGDVVVDHEWAWRHEHGVLTRYEVLATYTVANGKIVTATFLQVPCPPASPPTI